jgi:Uma2 family endonuclease
MSILTLPTATAPFTSSTNPHPKRWTVHEFHQLWDAGWFGDSRPMLIDGEILVMPNPNPPHAMGTTLADYALKALFGAGFVVRVQQSLLLGQSTDPEPDLAVVEGAPRDYVDHPTGALLVVEVADSTLQFDTGDKASLYAAGGISDYWVVDLNHAQVIVFRDPQPDPTQRFGFGFASSQNLDRSATIGPVAAPKSLIRIADLLP